ncbi:MAG: hypothetical protein EOP62_20655 [Sphingomonadales bacterium]|nr:MAG: hypothetical protein EOP62_20655 [Sphingomonadales bacterium]
MAAALLAAATMAWPAHASGCDDPFVGVWQLDLANSKFTASAGVRNKTLIFSKVAAGMLITETVVTDEGETAVYRIPFTYGGGFATQDANPAYDALAVERLDARTLVSTLKFRGAVVGKAKQKISADGKSMEFTSELTLQSGAVARQESLFRRM